MTPSVKLLNKPAQKRTSKSIKQPTTVKALEQILDKTIDKTIAKHLSHLRGSDVTSPELQRDLSFLHTLRKRCEESSSLFFRIILSSTIAAMAIALWEGVKVLLKR